MLFWIPSFPKCFRKYLWKASLFSEKLRNKIISQDFTHHFTHSFTFTLSLLHPQLSTSHCAMYNGGGWWYSQCQVSNLNGPRDVGMVWYNRAWRDWMQMTDTVMMIRPRTRTWSVTVTCYDYSPLTFVMVYGYSPWLFAMNIRQGFCQVYSLSLFTRYMQME